MTHAVSDRRFLAVVVLACVSLAVACTERERAPKIIELINWWERDGEARALAALIDAFEAKNTDQEVQNIFKSGSGAARNTIQERMRDGDPPDIFQANGGWDLLAWVLYDPLDDRGSKMEALRNTEAWRGMFPDAVLNTVSWGNTIYAVPLNVHRVNTVFVNAKVFHDHGLPEPTGAELPTIDDLFALLESLRASGVEYPLTIGMAESWTLGILFFENILVARAKADYYRQFFEGEVDPLTSAPLLAAVRDLSRLLSFTNERDAALQTWDSALSQVRNGQAAMTIMGDWAKGYLRAREEQMPIGVELGDELKEIVMPGTEGTFVFTVDTLGIPKGAPNPEGARRFLQFAASAAGQKAFNLPKGSISARSDADINDYDVLEHKTILDFTAAAQDQTRLIPATAIRAPAQYTDEIFSALSDFVGTGTSVGPVKGNESVLLHAFKNWSDVLRESKWP